MKNKTLKVQILISWLLLMAVTLLTACGNTPTPNAPTAATATPVIPTATSKPASTATPIVAIPTPTVTSTANPALDTPFQIKYDQQVTISSEKLTLKFSTIVEDSRCPVDVACAHSGWATVSVVVAKEGQPSKVVNLKVYGSSSLGPKNENVAKADNYSFTLMKVDPPRNTKTTLQKADYVVTLMVAKA